MSNKNAISILQELMVAKKEQLPLYIDKGTVTDKFVCSVFVDGIEAVGQGTTKKAAKLESAEIALASLNASSKQIIEEKHNIKEYQPLSITGVENSVGILNEMASQNGFEYPIYEFITMMHGEFVMSCAFLGHNVKGRGTTKKLAKKHAAAKMLEIMKSSDLSQYTSHKKVLMFSKEDISDYQKVIEKYALISLDADSQKAIIFKAEPNPKACIELPVEEDTLQNYQNKIQLLGVDYSTLEVRSKNPCIFGIKILPSSHCFLGNGSSKEEALKNGFKSVLEGFRDGLDFYKKNAFLKS